VVVCVALLLLLPKVVQVAVSVVVTPVNITRHWLTESGGSLPQYFRNRSTLIEQIATLESKLSAESGDRFTTALLAKENAELRSLLGDQKEERILAGIIGRPGSLPYDSLMLDKGTSDGVFVGAPIYIGENTVVGLVKSATNHSALVELVTTAGFETTVYIMGPDIYTNAVGVGGGQMRVGVPQGIVLSVGDVVVLPSVTSGVYGEISLVQSDATRPEQYGYVSPKTSLASIRLVAVGKTPLRSMSFEEAQKIISETKTKVFLVPVPEHILVDTQGTTSASSTDDNLITP